MPFPVEVVNSGSTIKSDELYGQINYESSANTLFSLGVLYRNDNTSNSNLDFFDPSSPERPFSERFEQTGLWSQIQCRLTNALEVRLGGRYDEYTDYDSSLDGSIEVLYFFTRLGSVLFAKLATSYAPPSASDIAFDQDPVGTPLNSEESNSYEVGFRQLLFGEKLSLSTVIFRNEIDNLVTFEGSDILNLDRATTEGV